MDLGHFFSRGVVNLWNSGEAKTPVIFKAEIDRLVRVSGVYGANGVKGKIDQP